ncbi:hypothetical protein HDU96_002058, partial [Phlyctochytrium bullatum]
LIPWRCEVCQAKPEATFVLRQNAAGVRSLCDNCGLNLKRARFNGQVPPQAITDGETAATDDPAKLEAPSTPQLHHASTTTTPQRHASPPPAPPSGAANAATTQRDDDPAPYRYPQLVVPVQASPVKIIEPKKVARGNRGRPPGSSTLRFSHGPAAGVAPGTPGAGAAGGGGGGMTPVPHAGSFGE